MPASWIGNSLNRKNMRILLLRKFTDMDLGWFRPPWPLPSYVNVLLIGFYQYNADLCGSVNMDLIHPWIGLDWIGLGGMTVTPFLIGNHCITVDAVSFKL